MTNKRVAYFYHGKFPSKTNILKKKIYHNFIMVKNTQ